MGPIILYAIVFVGVPMVLMLAVLHGAADSDRQAQRMIERERGRS